MKQALIKSFISLIAVTFLFIGSTLAWILSSNSNFVNPIQIKFSPNDFEYQFFIYQDSLLSGSGSKKLHEHLCIDDTDDFCFNEFDEQTPFVFSTNPQIRPSNRFSFALKVTNISDTSRVMLVSLTKLLSTGFSLESNKAQRAFQYSTTKVVYWSSDEESVDMKDLLAIQYAGDSINGPRHFTLADEFKFMLVSHLVLNSSGSSQSAIIYFDIYFDPAIKGLDEFDISTGNSNAFQNQIFQIRQLLIEPIIP